MSSKVLVPEVRWAQRSNETDPEKNYLLLTISIPDCEDPVLKIEPTFFDLTAKSEGHVGDEATHEYKLHIDFFKDVVAEKTQHKKANGQHYFLKIFKKDMQLEYWPRLTKEKIKYSNIKTDFDKWVDEDEQDEVVKNDNDYEALGGAGGMPGGPGGMDFASMMGGAGGAGGMDFASMMGGAGGAGGAGGMDFSQLLSGAGGADGLKDLLKGQNMEGLMGKAGEEDHEHDHEHDHDHDHDHKEDEEKDASA